MKRAKIFNSKGFTLLEVMVAEAVIGVLASIATPKYMNYRDKAVAASCLTNRHYIDMEEQSYYIENDKSSLQIDDEWSCLDRRAFAPGIRKYPTTMWKSCLNDSTCLPALIEKEERYEKSTKVLE